MPVIDLLTWNYLIHNYCDFPNLFKAISYNPKKQLMCLVLENKNSQPQVAEADIICYKVLVKHQDGLFTLYTKTPVSVGSTYESEFSFTEWGDIDCGLHSFGRLIQANDFIDIWLTPSTVEYVLCKCCIPKGSRYYQGSFCGCLSYASDKLSYLEIIND